MKTCVEHGIIAIMIATCALLIVSRKTGQKSNSKYHIVKPSSSSRVLTMEDMEVRVLEVSWIRTIVSVQNDDCPQPAVQ